jgi:hypothetical protein
MSSLPRGTSQPGPVVEPLPRRSPQAVVEEPRPRRLPSGGEETRSEETPKPVVEKVQETVEVVEVAQPVQAQESQQELPVSEPPVDDAPKPEPKEEPALDEQPVAPAQESAPTLSKSTSKKRG